MADTAAGIAAGAQDQESAPPPPQNDEGKDPFAGFESEAFVSGERVEETPAKPAAKPAAGAPPAPKEAGEGAGTEGDGGEPGDDAGSDRGDDAGGTAGAPKKSVQERINELTRARREAERRAEAAERELQAARAAAAPPSPPAAPPKAAGTQESGKPAGDGGDAAKGAPDPEQYEFGELDSRYIRDLARFEADQRFAELREQEMQERQQVQMSQQQQAAREKFQVRVEEGSKRYDDFYEKVVIGAEKLDWVLSPELGQLIVDSDVGADIAYHLATNPDEAARVFAQSPVEQARYFGRMESKFSAAQSAAPGEDAKDEAAPTKTPKAPPPIPSARGAGGRSPVSANTDDFASFEAVVMERK